MRGTAPRLRGRRRRRAATRSRPGEQGLHILEATLAVYLSAATGETVALPLPADHPVSRIGRRRPGRARPAAVEPGPAAGPVRARRSARSATEDDVDLGLYTDSVDSLSFEERARPGRADRVRGIEIAAGGQSSAPHMRIAELLEDAGARASASAAAFAERGLRIAALNCSAWPLHPVVGAAARRAHPRRHPPRRPPRRGQDRDDVRLSWRRSRRDHHRLGLVSVAGGHGRAPGASVGGGDPVLGGDGGLRRATTACERIAFELHPLHLVYNVPTLLRMREAVGPSHRRERRPVAHVLAADGPARRDPRRWDRPSTTSISRTRSWSPDQVALAGVLDQRPVRATRRSAPGSSGPSAAATTGPSGPRSWRSLREVGYDDVLSIENEDVSQPPRKASRRRPPSCCRC